MASDDLNKTISDAKAAVHIAHSKAVVMYDLAFASDSLLALSKINLTEESEEAWRVASANWRESVRAMEDDIAAVPEYISVLPVRHMRLLRLRSWYLRPNAIVVSEPIGS
jgi:hypothetical protein